MKTLYRMAWHQSPYAKGKEKGDTTDTFMDDIKPTIVEAISAFFENYGESFEAALKPEEYLIYAISVEDDLGDDDTGIRNGTIEDIIPLEKAYSEGKAE